MTIYTILLGGEVVVTKKLKKQIADSVVVAADSGISHAAKLGVRPQIWLGDFDSCMESDLLSYSDSYSDAEIIEYDVNKDKTDGELAIDEALRRGASKLILCGAFGGPRVDHTMAHMLLSLKLAKNNIDNLLTSGDREAVPILGSKQYQLSKELSCRSFDWEEDTTFSIVPFTQLCGLTISGAEWNLKGDKLIEFGSTCTLSNCSLGNSEISLEKGEAIIVSI